MIDLNKYDDTLLLLIGFFQLLLLDPEYNSHNLYIRNIYRYDLSISQRLNEYNKNNHLNLIDSTNLSGKEFEPKDFICFEKDVNIDSYRYRGMKLNNLYNNLEEVINYLINDDSSHIKDEKLNNQIKLFKSHLLNNIILFKNTCLYSFNEEKANQAFLLMKLILKKLFTVDSVIFNANNNLILEFDFPNVFIGNIEDILTDFLKSDFNISKYSIYSNLNKKIYKIGAPYSLHFKYEYSRQDKSISLKNKLNIYSKEQFPKDLFNFFYLIIPIKDYDPYNTGRRFSLIEDLLTPYHICKPSLINLYKELKNKENTF